MDATSNPAIAKLEQAMAELEGVVEQVKANALLSKRDQQRHAALRSEVAETIDEITRLIGDGVD